MRRDELYGLILAWCKEVMLYKNQNAIVKSKMTNAVLRYQGAS